ncbi:hypothetical protein CAPTEDRAFT_217533 [Capitella teleta]|uniref:G-protein coupled receptors family 1 profile domain-containing protein n=1 Tax=Capitella teleta TaxID=283909 RepID=R7UGU8_CAPTE|nr:hypothetical protein CAPTEDRAFT_217533 [Capitella teleta]|eukprot:ELU03008.1 hypothetical protein CAPTEDRAFT_217533 [Capitella teleta]
MDSTTDGYFTTAPAAAAINTKPCVLQNFILGSLVGGFTIVPGLLGNVLSLIILGKERKKSPTIQALCLLAVADSMLLLSYLSMVAFGIRGMTNGYYEALPVGVFTSVYMYELARIFNQVSTFLTVILMWQRYVAVCLPHKAKQICTVRMVNTTSACSSVAACVFYLPNFFLYSIKSSNDGFFYPVSRPLVLNTYFQTIYSVILTYLVSYIVPVASLICMSVAILRCLKSHSNSATSSNSNARQDLTKSSIAIVIIFVLCQSFQPIRRVLMWAYDPFIPNVTCGGDLQYFAYVPHVALVLNSSANFSVYVLFAKGFRGKLIAFLPRKNAVAPIDVGPAHIQ